MSERACTVCATPLDFVATWSMPVPEKWTNPKDEDTPALCWECYRGALVEGARAIFCVPALSPEQPAVEGEGGREEVVTHPRDCACELCKPTPPPGQGLSLREAAQHMLNESKAILGVSERALREDAGDTNVTVFKLRMDELEAALGRADVETEKLTREATKVVHEIRIHKGSVMECFACQQFANDLEAALPAGKWGA